MCMGKRRSEDRDAVIPPLFFMLIVVVYAVLEDTPLDHMTPLDALNLLHQLKKELQQK